MADSPSTDFHRSSACAAAAVPVVASATNGGGAALAAASASSSAVPVSSSVAPAVSATSSVASAAAASAPCCAVAGDFPKDPGLVVFAYSDVGYACLKLILERGVRVRAVFTHEDSPQEEQWFGSVSALAEQYGVPVYRPEKITRAEHEELIFNRLGARLLLSFYYRNLLPTWLWSGMELGAYNMHGSYLPSYRGRAPLNWAIINGEDHTGVTLHFMVKEADAGDIVDQEKVMIGAEETAISVRERACYAAVEVMERQLENLLRGTPPRQTQDPALISYFGKRTPEDGRIDWSKSATEVFNLVRALTRPYPGAFTEEFAAAGAENGGRLFVWWGRVRGELGGTPGTVLSAEPLIVACGKGAFEITDCELRR